MSARALTIGRLARRAGVNVETIRYYQRRGLVREPPRPAYGYRYYPAETAVRVCFIKRAQRLGFTLREIGELLSISDGHCTEVHAFAEAKCRSIRTQVRDLEALYASLHRMASQCTDAPRAPSANCSIIAALMNDQGGAARPSKEDGSAADVRRSRYRGSSSLARVSACIEPDRRRVAD